MVQPPPPHRINVAFFQHQTQLRCRPVLQKAPPTADHSLIFVTEVSTLLWLFQSSYSTEVSHIPLLVALAMTKGEKKRRCLRSWGLGERREEPTENTPSHDEYSGGMKGKTETPYLQELLLSYPLNLYCNLLNAPLKVMQICVSDDQQNLSPCITLVSL